VTGREAIHTFHFDYEKILDEEVGKVLADRVALVADRQGSLGGGPDATEGQFPQESALIDFLEESGAKGVGNLEDRGEHTAGQGVAVSVAMFIGVHRWLMLVCARLGIFSRQLGHR
jgi:hypothetical protein